MVVDDGNFDIMDIEDLILDDIDKRPSFHEFPESQLCVPPDPIEDLEWFPSFSDDFISLSGVGLMPEHEISSNFFASAKPRHYQPPDKLTVCNFPVTPEQLDHGKTKPLPKTVKRQNGSGMEKVRVEISEAEFAGFINKKARTRKRGNKLEDQKRKRGLAEKWVRKRCSHCQTEETPQWRVGPLGPKTLCNACGVRFKSGRLVPEYRPASSPTFDGFRHSNYHRKILKMRGLVNYDDY